MTWRDHVTCRTSSSSQRKIVTTLSLGSLAAMIHWNVYARRTVQRLPVKGCKQRIQRRYARHFTVTKPRTKNIFRRIIEKIASVKFLEYLWCVR